MERLLSGLGLDIFIRNTEGTLNYNGRRHKFQVTLIPDNAATVAKPSGNNIIVTYLDTVFYTDPSGNYTTGLDADMTGHISFNATGFSDTPGTHYTGNGFGGAGSGGVRIPTDTEGLIVNTDGTYWVSDEYGPYIYQMNNAGQMLQAIRPPDALIPMRNGTER